VAEHDVVGPETLVLLHGFAGTRRMWDQVIAHLDPQRYRPLALDLPGHGDLYSYKRPITFAGCVQEVLATTPERFALCGYSLGGRVALHVADLAPERVTRLMLISSSPGIDDPARRARRRRADRRLADDLDGRPFERFLDSWSSQALFADDPPGVTALARADQRRNDPHALATALRALGAGEMKPLCESITRLAMPLTVVVGSRDTKYRELGLRMVGLARGSSLVEIEGGHRLPLQQPREIARLIGAARPLAAPGMCAFYAGYESDALA
jgi:2-succinyl-6-hydroxy-2,4-cyclohexadiene-1-carboxylate synthase